MVKVKHSFKNLDQAPALKELVAETRKKVKGLQCSTHPNEESAVKMKLVYGKSEHEIEACCHNFDTTIRAAIYSRHTGA